MTMDRYFSDELFHFVGRRAPDDHERNYAVVKAILAGGYISHPPHKPGLGEISTRVDLSKGLLSEDLVVPSVVCFCDIPREHLAIHVGKYGPFGLAFDKSLLVSCGARPVMYVPHYSADNFSVFGKAFLRHVEATYRGYREHVLDKVDREPTRTFVHGAKPSSSTEAMSGLDSIVVRDFLAFLKPFDAELPDDHPDQFYAEREWRKYANFLFKPEHVRRVLVADGYHKRVEKDLPQFLGRVEVV